MRVEGQRLVLEVVNGERFDPLARDGDLADGERGGFA